MSLTPATQQIIINRQKFKLEFWQRSKFALFQMIDWKLTHQYPIAVGMKGRATNAGMYMVWNKDDTPEWTMPDETWVAEELRGHTLAFDDPNNPIKARWIGFNPNEAEGIHGTSDDASIGSRASHGCVRMHIPDVIELFDIVKKGCSVYVI